MASDATKTVFETEAEPSAGYLALLQDCRSALTLALKAVEIGATPGPGWQRSTRDTIKLIDMVLAPRKKK